MEEVLVTTKENVLHVLKVLFNLLYDFFLQKQSFSIYYYYLSLFIYLLVVHSLQTFFFYIPLYVSVNIFLISLWEHPEWIYHIQFLLESVLSSYSDIVSLILIYYLLFGYRSKILLIRHIHSQNIVCECVFVHATKHTHTLLWHLKRPAGWH